MNSFIFKCPHIYFVSTFVISSLCYEKKKIELSDFKDQLNKKKKYLGGWLLFWKVTQLIRSFRYVYECIIRYLIPKCDIFRIQINRWIKSRSWFIKKLDLNNIFYNNKNVIA